MNNFKDFTINQIISLAKSYNDIIERYSYNAKSYLPHTIVYEPGPGIEWVISEIVNRFEHIITFYKCANLNNFLNVSIHLEEYLEVA